MDSGDTIAVIVVIFLPWLLSIVLPFFILKMKKRIKELQREISYQKDQIGHYVKQIELLEKISNGHTGKEIIPSAEPKIQTSNDRDIKEAIKSAIDNKATLEIRYYGGSKPGAARKIQPKSIGNEKIRARCLEDNYVKTYFIERIEIIGSNFDKPTNVKTQKQATIQDIQQVLTYSKDTLESMGWAVNSSINTISLHERFKNGKPKKAPVIQITYEKFSNSQISDGEAISSVRLSSGAQKLDSNDIPEHEPRLKTKPWIVRAKGKTTSSFQNGQNAMEKFLELSQEFATDSII